MTEEFNAIKKDAGGRMDSALQVLAGNFRKLRTGRAHASLVEDIKAEYYGNPTPINQMANIGTPDARTISITPYDQTQLEAIAKAIQTADLGLNPNMSKDAVIINLPPLNEESRNDFRKHARSEAEQSRIAIRNVRRDAMQKSKDIATSEDLEKEQAHEIDNLTEEFIKKVDALLQEKENDLMQI